MSGVTLSASIDSPPDAVWIFGYGSLIWRPGFPYRHRQPSVLEGWHRAFCRYSFHHRGTPDHPGLVVGLRRGKSCVGMAYRIDTEHQRETLDYLDEREGTGYLRTEVTLRLLEQNTAAGSSGNTAAGSAGNTAAGSAGNTAAGIAGNTAAGSAGNTAAGSAAYATENGTENITVTAWSYIPNPDHPSYFGEEDPENLTRLVATGRGRSGTALDYLRELISNLQRLQVKEPELAAILRAAERYPANNGGDGGG